MFCFVFPWAICSNLYGTPPQTAGWFYLMQHTKVQVQMQSFVWDQSVPPSNRGYTMHYTITKPLLGAIVPQDQDSWIMSEIRPLPASYQTNINIIWCWHAAALKMIFYWYHVTPFACASNFPVTIVITYSQTWMDSHQSSARSCIWQYSAYNLYPGLFQHVTYPV